MSRRRVGTVGRFTPLRVPTPVCPPGYVVCGRMSWAFLRECEVYEDPEKSTALDDYLVAIGGLDRVEGPCLVGAA